MKAEDLQIALRDAPFVRRFFFFPAIGSTNDKARDLATQGMDEGTLVIADHQTAGRGRMDRSWFSPPGVGIYVSFLFRPDLPVNRAFGTLAAVALGTAEAAESVAGHLHVGIQWPNDLLVGEAKVAGILSEVGTSGGRVDWSVVGVGLNVNHAVESFPAELRERATSLHLATGREIDRVELLRRMVDRVAVWYEELRRTGLEPLLAAWRERSTILGREVRVETAGETYVGKAVALEPDGALRIRLEAGSEEILHAGDVYLAQFR